MVNENKPVSGNGPQKIEIDHVMPGADVIQVGEEQLALGFPEEVVKAWLKQPRTGKQGLIGEVGVALTNLDTEGKVAIHGEYWNANADGHILKGEKVRVIRVDDLCLKVTRDPRR